MDTNTLKKFAQSARNLLIDQVTAKLALVLDPASPARREQPEATRKLDAAITAKGKAQVVEQVAYTRVGAEGQGGGGLGARVEGL